MKNFFKLQNQFQEFLLHKNENIFHDILSTPKVPANIRLAIYKNAYQSRLQQALASNYPILYKYMGEEQFERMAMAYLNELPSSFPSIRWFGNELPNFLEKSSEWQAFPYLSELAKWEWACGLVFDEADSPVLKIEEMGSIPPDAWTRMRFKIHSTVRYLSLSWNTVAIWQALTEDQTPNEPQKTLTPVNWILWRKDLACQFSSLLKDEAWAINATLEGSTFGEICEGLGLWYDNQEAGHRAASLLKSWITTGLIESVIF